MNYELVIGLETHIELATKTKIFCGCKAEFGGEANTHCCPICIGLPGVLPKLNKKVVEYAILAGLATNCKISNISKMDRKNYIYPDLPKAYQISQFDLPLCYDGSIKLSDGSVIGITRIHIEEDAGKLIHEGGDIYIDYNRGGVPLIEIVSEPDFRTTAQVREYLETLQSIMRYLGISDCKMQEGSLRCDVNISVRPVGQKEFGTRTEIKNMNSFTFIVKAIESEFNRQIEVLENGGTIVQSTMRFDESTGETHPMREKEDSHDYRYFREPDLVTIFNDDETINKLRETLPELSFDKLCRYVSEYNLSEQDAILLTKHFKIAKYFEAMIEITGNAKASASVMLSSLFKSLETEADKEDCNIAVPPEYICEVINLQLNNKINSTVSKKLIEKMLKEKKLLSEIATEDDLKEVDTGELTTLIQKVIGDNPKIVEDYKNGKEKAILALIGMVMRETKGKADPKFTECEIIRIINS